LVKNESTTESRDESVSDRVRDIVRQQFRSSLREQVLRVDSDIAMRAVKELIHEEYAPLLADGVMFNLAVDYSLEQPMAHILDMQEVKDADKFHELDEVDSHQRILDAVFINKPFDLLEEAGYRVNIFAKNPQEASVPQIRALTSLMIHINNCAGLPNARLYLPGGDWWSNPDNIADKLADGSDGGYMFYSRWERLASYGLPSNEMHAQARDLGADMLDENAPTINVHGLDYSGKTAFLNMLAETSMMIRQCRNLITVYPKLRGEKGADAFIAEIESRESREPKGLERGNWPLFIDGADMLAPNTLAKAREMYPKFACTSKEKMPGFDKYIDTVEFAKKID